MRNTLIFVILIISMIFLTGCNTQREEIIKIGVVLPLTSEGTTDQAQASQQAILLAVDEINAQGGINGKKVEAIFEDSQCQASKGVTGINKLINIDKVVFIIGDICDFVTGAIMPVAETNKVVLITPGSTSPDISEAGDYIFRFWFSEDELGGMVAEEVRSEGMDRLAIIYINNAWGTAQHDSVKRRFEEIGGRVVAEEVVDPGTADYRTVLLKTEDKFPDSYYIGLHPDGLVLTMKRMQELNINKPVFSHGGLIGSTQTLGLGGDLLEGIVAPFIYNPRPEFRDKFVERFGTEPGITADSSYDSVQAVVRIIKRTGKTDSDTIKNGLYELQNYEGVSGKISVDKKGDVHRPLRLMIVEDRELREYKK